MGDGWWPILARARLLISSCRSACLTPTHCFGIISPLMLFVAHCHLHETCPGYFVGHGQSQGPTSVLPIECLSSSAFYFLDFHPNQERMDSSCT
ncbi:hypothetical protein F5X97DRAFT_242308 [Nemania serpens]|nr:hypothetical protein F5X97DRAFT_242308 [Nemania serpens]